MRVFCAVLLVAGALFASAIARPGSKSHSQKRHARSLMFPHGPRNPRFNPFSQDENDYFADRFPPHQEFGEHFDSPFGKKEKDHQVNTNNIDEYVDSNQDNDQDEFGDFGKYGKNEHHNSEDDVNKHQSSAEVLKRLLHSHRNDVQLDNAHDNDDEYDDADDDDDDDDVNDNSNENEGDDDDADEDDDDVNDNSNENEGDDDAGDDDDENDEEDDDDDDDYDGDDDDDDDDDEDDFDRVVSEHDRTSLNRVIEYIKKVLDPKGKDFQETTDIDDSPQDNGQDIDDNNVESDEGFAEDRSHDVEPRVPLVPKFDDMYDAPFHGHDDDYEIKTKEFYKNFNSPEYKGQDKKGEVNDSDEFDDSDEFADSHEFDDSDEFADSNEFDDSDEFADSHKFDDSDEFADDHEFGFDDKHKWQGKDETQDKTKNQDADLDQFSNDINGNDSPQNTDGDGIIQPRVGINTRFSGRDDYDFVPEVQLWKRSISRSKRSHLSDKCDDICNIVKLGGKNSPRIRKLCNCNDRGVRHV